MKYSAYIHKWKKHNILFWVNGLHRCWGVFSSRPIQSSLPTFIYEFLQNDHKAVKIAATRGVWKGMTLPCDPWFVHKCAFSRSYIWLPLWTQQTISFTQKEEYQKKKQKKNPSLCYCPTHSMGEQDGPSMKCIAWKGMSMLNLLYEKYYSFPNHSSYDMFFNTQVHRRFRNTIGW